MSFDKQGFTPVHINAGAHAPRIFAYRNKKDTLEEILKPGYFNMRKILLRPDSFMDVICKDKTARLVVEKNTGDVTFKDEMIIFETQEERAVKKTKGKPEKSLSKAG